MSRLGLMLMAQALLREAARVELHLARGGDGLKVLQLHGERCAHEFVRGVLVEALGEEAVATLAAEVGASTETAALARLAASKRLERALNVWCDGTGYISGGDGLLHGYEPRACGGCVNCIPDDEPVPYRIAVSKRPGEPLVAGESER